MANYDDFEDKNIIHIDENFNKINPDYYIHLAYIKCINALDSEDLNSGKIKLITSVNMLEVLARSSKKLPDSYDEEIKQKNKESPEQNAIRKLGAISKYIFSSKANFSSLSDNK